MRRLATPTLASSLLLLTGCAADATNPGTPPATTSATSQPASPNLQYPMAMTMVQVFESPAPIDAAAALGQRPHDRQVVGDLGKGGLSVMNPKVSPANAVTPKAWAAVVPPSGRDQLLRSVRNLPGVKFAAVPVFIGQPGAPIAQPANAKDKAGAPTGVALTLAVKEPAANTTPGNVALTLSCGSAAGLPLLRCDNLPVPEGAALVTAFPGEPGTWRILVATPTIIRSAAEYPFQTSTSTLARPATP